MKEIKIAKVISNYKLALNAGSTDGVKNGQRFLIYTLGDDIVDPDTGESLGQLERVKGTGRVTHLQDKICTITSDMKVSVGKTFRRYTEPSSLTTLGSLYKYFEPREVEEELPPEPSPFEDPETGDLARPV
ncbi:MAG: hypothetical protein RIE53_10280 [Rhodothermales bacterium]